MIKYQINIHVKNDDLPDLVRGEEYDPKIFYHVNYKGIFDSIEEGFDYIRVTYEKIIEKHAIKHFDILKSTHITKIDTDRCKKWEKLFLIK